MHYKIKNQYNHEEKVLIIYDEGYVFEIHEDDKDYNTFVNNLLENNLDFVKDKLKSEFVHFRLRESFL